MECLVGSVLTRCRAAEALGGDMTPQVERWIEGLGEECVFYGAEWFFSPLVSTGQAVSGTSNSSSLLPFFPSPLRPSPPHPPLRPPGSELWQRLSRLTLHRTVKCPHHQHGSAG